MTFKQWEPHTRDIHLRKRMGIFVASYKKDFPYLHGLLISIKKFCHGFQDVRVAVPKEDERELCGLLAKWKVDHLVTTGTQDAEIPDGFMRAQFAMMSMDRYMMDCEVFCLVGSDCLFVDHVTPSYYLCPNGKPWMVARHLKPEDPNHCWNSGTLKATGFSPELHYMCRLPIFYTPNVLRAARWRVSKHVGMPLKNYLALERHRDFSESNVIGVCAHKTCSTEYEWCFDKEPPVDRRLVQFWSWGGLHTHKMDRSEPYKDTRGVAKTTHQRTAYEVTLDVLGENY